VKLWFSPLRTSHNRILSPFYNPDWGIPEARSHCLNLPKLIAFSIAFGPFAPWTRFTDFWFAAWFSFNFRWGWVAINVGQTWIRLDSFSITRVAWTVTWTPFFPFTRTTAFWPVACLAFFEFIRAVAVFWSWFGEPWWTDAFSEWYCYRMFYRKTHFWVKPKHILETRWQLCRLETKFGNAKCIL